MEAVVDRHRHLRLAVLGDGDVVDRADLLAADLDKVALHQLRRVDEVGLDRVAARPACEQEDSDDHYGYCDRRNGRDASRDAQVCIPCLLSSQPGLPPVGVRSTGRRRNLQEMVPQKRR